MYHRLIGRAEQIHDVVASRVRPVRELKGFRKVPLAPGKSLDVSFTLTRSDLSFAALQGGKGQHQHQHQHQHDGRHDDGIEADSAAQTVEPGLFDVWVTHSAVGGAEDGEMASPLQFELHAPGCLLPDSSK